MSTQPQDQKSFDIESYRQLLDILFNTHHPLSADEANILLRLFPKDSSEQVGNGIASIIQTIECSRAQFREILHNAPSEQLRNELVQRFSALRGAKT
ncbi:MAG: hypothetical protein K2N54_01800 [Helicobacter sp.]|nr:hypothetical protein [Helicobacter sp.]MDE7254893.1 hypothetical protein [Helicobacter sp.]